MANLTVERGTDRGPVVFCKTEWYSIAYGVVELALQEGHPVVIVKDEFGHEETFTEDNRPPVEGYFEMAFK